MRLRPIRLSFCLSVSYLCRLLNVSTRHCADVPFNWRQPAAATTGSQQQACCVSLCTLSGLSTVGDRAFRSPPLVSGTVFRRLAARHVSTVTGHLSQSPHVSSLQALLFITLILPLSCRVRELTCHYGDVNRFCYLLTYLLTTVISPIDQADIFVLQVDHDAHHAQRNDKHHNYLVFF